MRTLLLILVACAAGCGGGTTSYMPLAKGNHWVYLVTIDPESTYQDLRVVREASVGSTRGWLLESEMGDCRLGWQGGILLAAELGGTAYSPPVPLFAEDGAKWQGVLATATVSTAATATMRRTNESLDVAGRKYRTVKCVLDLQSSQGPLQLTTWFFPGMGILRQEQRSGPALVRDRRIDFVSGP